MLKHIVMWKLKDFAAGKSKQENVLLIKGMLEALPAKIPQIKALEVGVNVNPSDQAYDAVLYTEFKDHEDLETYLKHPEHKKVSEHVGVILHAKWHSKNSGFSMHGKI